MLAGVALRLAAAAPAEIDATGHMTPHVGDWKIRKGAFATKGDEPPGGWYLRSQRHYDLQRFSCEVRRESETGIVYIYTRDWRILLRRNAVTVKNTSSWGPGKPPYLYWPYYFFSATRPIDFTPGRWHDFALGLDGTHLTIRWDGREVLKWRSPQEEWGPRVLAAGKVPRAEQFEFPDRLPAHAVAGRDQILVLQAFRTQAAFRTLRLRAVDKGETQEFDMNVRSGPYSKLDCELDRLAPLAPVNVDWDLPAAEKKKAEGLPALERWTVEDMVDPKKHYGISRDKKINNPVTNVEYFVGAKDPGKFPQFLHHHFRSHLFGNPRMPQSVSMYFNLAKAGGYTLKLELGSHRLGWGPNVLEASVDGRPVSREVYRPTCQWSSSCEIRDYVPLRLAAGPHRIDLALDLSLLKRPHHLQKHLRVGCQVAFEPGVHEPLFVYRARQQNNQGQSDRAFEYRLSVGEQVGKVIRYRITGLAPFAKYALRLGFQEVDINAPGARLMDVYVNGECVERGLDVYREAGFTWLERTYKAVASMAVDKEGAEAPDYAFELKLVGRNFKAFLNSLHVEDAEGEVVLRENCGWVPILDSYLSRRGYVPVWDTTPMPAEPAPWTEDAPFDGHNLAANPHFSLVDERGKPTWWHSLKDMFEKTKREYPIDALRASGLAEALLAVYAKRKHQPHVLAHYNILQGEGEYAHDAEVGCEQPGSLRIGKTGPDFGVTCNWPPVDYGKRQKFSVRIKTENATGAAVPEILWFAMDANALDTKWLDTGSAGSPLPTPRLQLIGRTAGKPVTGTADWQEVVVEAMPPFGAVYAALVIRAERNTAGSIWVDDVEFNGYGAEPFEVTWSFAGYHPKSDKQIVVKSLAKAPVTWRLLSLPDGEPVRSGEAEHHSWQWWSKRHFYTLDFSDLEEEGEYRLEATQGERTAVAGPFAVSRNTYRELARKLLYGFYAKRWSCDLPGVKAPECLEDAHMLAAVPDHRFNVFEQVFFPERKDMLGGWYDAGDQIKHVEYWAAVCQALDLLLTHVKKPFRDRTDNDILDELVWGFDSFRKYQLPRGDFLYNIKPNAMASDNIPGYGIDRYAQRALPVPQAAGTFARGSIVLRKLNPKLSRACLDAAKRNYEFARLWQKAENDPEERNRFFCAAKCLFAEIHLYKATRKRVYRQRLDRHVELVADGVLRGLYRGSSEMVHGSHMYATMVQDCVWVLCHFLREHPDHPAADRAKGALWTFAERVRRVSSFSPWRQAHDLTTPDTEKPLFWPRTSRHIRPIGYWPGLAHSLAEVGMTLRDPGIIRLAERQLQFLLGKNFADISVVHGVGQRFFAGGDYVYWQAEFFDAWLKSDKKLYYFDGQVPTMAMRDTGTGEPQWQPGDNWAAPLIGWPKGYCAIHVTADYPYHPGPSEYFTER